MAKEGEVPNIDEIAAKVMEKLRIGGGGQTGGSGFFCGDVFRCGEFNCPAGTHGCNGSLFECNIKFSENKGISPL
jgi:hypothetical protein